MSRAKFKAALDNKNRQCIAGNRIGNENVSQAQSPGGCPLWEVINAKNLKLGGAFLNRVVLLMVLFQ